MTTDADKINLERGREFQRRLSISAHKKVEFANLMGLKNAQNLTHWYTRGVPAKFAAKAAGYLDCDPQEISAVESPADSAQEAEVMLERRKRELRRMLNDILDSAPRNLQLYQLTEAQIEALHKMISK